MKNLVELSSDKFRMLAEAGPRFISVVFLDLQMPIEDKIYFELWDVIWDDFKK